MANEQVRNTTQHRYSLGKAQADHRDLSLLSQLKRLLLDKIKVSEKRELSHTIDGHENYIRYYGKRCGAL